MAKTGDRARDFLQELKRQTAAHFARENQGLRAFRRELDGHEQLNPWDVAYYAEKQRQALYDFDEEALRPYFPLDRVVERLVRDRESPVRRARQRTGSGRRSGIRGRNTTRIRDEDGTLLGCFYADWFPRENKRGGAWMDVADHRRGRYRAVSSRTWGRFAGT